MFACDYEDCCCKPVIGCHALTEISGIYFCDGTHITPSGGIIYISGDIDMCCNSILDVSKIGFCCNIILDAYPCPSANIAIGNYIGIDDGSNTISIGNYAGSSGQQNFSIAMGYAAGKSDQKERSIAIGYKAGELNQHSQTIIINAQDASLNSVDPSAFYVAPIRKAANKQLLYYDISSKEITYDLWNVSCGDISDVSNIYFCNGTAILGPSGTHLTISGDLDMSCNRIYDVSKLGFCCNIIIDASMCPSGNIAIGNNIGIDDASNTISIGNYAGSSGQQNFSIAMGCEAGKTDQSKNAIAIGYKAGELNQHSQTIIINAQDASLNSVDPSAFYVAPIRLAANKQLLYYDVFTKEITHGLWNVSCGDISDVSNIYFCNGTAILGPSGEPEPQLTISGNLDMSCNRIYDVSKLGFCCNIIIDASMCPSGNIAIGNNIGIDDASNTISIGNYAGSSGQQNFSIAMGCEAGKTDQSKNAIAIGYKAGELNQHSQTIIINAQDASLNSVDPSAFYVAPIRLAANKQLLYYDVFTKEITYDLWNVSCGDISDVSNIYFCNGTAILGLSGEPEPQLTISGNLDMSCNKILDVSSITFCADIYIDTSSGALNPNIIIGKDISYSSDGSSNICIGNDINIGDGSENVIIGFGLGNTDICGSNLVLIGANNSTVAHTHKGNIAIGHQANYSPSGDFTISIGYHDRAGQAQKKGAIAIGYNSAISASRPYQGEYSIALGAYAGVTDMCKNSIVINATGSPLNTLDDPSRCYIKPIRQELSNNILFYDASSGEITWGKNPAYIPGEALDMSCSDISDVSNIYFCNHTAILGPSGEPEPQLTISGNLDMSWNEIIEVSNVKFCNKDALLGTHKNFSPLGYPDLPPLHIDRPVISVSGDLDMSCNYILDVSRIYFCGGPVSTGRNWIGVGTSFDISTNETLRMTVPDTSAAIIQVGLIPEMQVDASHVALQTGSANNPALNFGLGSQSDSGIFSPGSGSVSISVNGTQELMASTASRISIAGGTMGIPALNFGLASNDNTTGIYQVTSGQMGFSASGNIKAGVSTNNLSIIAGSAATPGINFGVTGTDTATGMYGVAANTIGFSTGNEQKLTIVGSSTLPAGMIDGINVGTTTNIAGIRRLSATPANSWEDGHLGNSEAIYFTATDFVQGGNPTIGSDGVNPIYTTLTAVAPGTANVAVYTGTWGGGLGRAATNTSTSTGGTPITEFVGKLTTTPGGNANFDFTIKRDATPQIGGQTTQTSSVFMAQKMIPKGFTFEDGVDTCTIFTNTATTVTTLNIYSQDIDSNPTATLLHTQPSYITNTPSAAFSPAETGDGVKSVIIEIDIGPNWTSDIILIGAKITMSRI